MASGVGVLQSSLGAGKSGDLRPCVCSSSLFMKWGDGTGAQGPSVSAVPDPCSVVVMNDLGIRG